MGPKRYSVEVASKLAQIRKNTPLSMRVLESRGRKINKPYPTLSPKKALTLNYAQKIAHMKPEEKIIIKAISKALKKTTDYADEHIAALALGELRNPKGGYKVSLTNRELSHTQVLYFLRYLKRKKLIVSKQKK